jgi:hypothetical protein
LIGFFSVFAWCIPEVNRLHRRLSTFEAFYADLLKKSTISSGRRRKKTLFVVRIDVRRKLFLL